MAVSVHVRRLVRASNDWTAGGVRSAAEVAFEDFIYQHCGERTGGNSGTTIPSHDMVSVLNTGTAVDLERWRERKARQKLLLEQTERLADVLERNDIPARTKNDSVYAVGLVTGDIDQLSHYRSICFLPAVAQRERAPLLNELRLFRKTHPMHRKYLRFAVVTCGPRLTAGSEGELREAFQQLHRDLSRWSQWAFRKYGIEVIGRFSEFTVQDEGNCRTVHPHANVLMTPQGPLSKRRWNSFLRETNERFGFWWSDQGRLKKPEEAIKYVCKPADLDAFSESEVVWLFNEIYGLKLVQPMGSFQEWRREMLCQRRENGSGWRQDRKVVSVNLGGSPQLRIVAKKRRRARIKPKKEITTEPCTCLLSITLPQRRASPWAEPYALISTPLDPVSLGHRAFFEEWEEETFWGDSSTEDLQEFLRARQAAKATWRANGAPDPEFALAAGRDWENAQVEQAGTVKPFIVHTYRPTARGEDIVAHLQGLEACLRDTERITTTYFDLVLGKDENTDGEFWDSDLILEQDYDSEDKFLDYELMPEEREEEEVVGERPIVIRSIPSQITPLASAPDWSP